MNQPPQLFESSPAQYLPVDELIIRAPAHNNRYQVFLPGRERAPQRPETLLEWVASSSYSC